MTSVWIPLSTSERTLLREALAAYAASGGPRRRTSLLIRRIEDAEVLPATVLRVEGGFVNVEANPNPVIVYDYDCDGIDELGPDERGRPCIVSEFEPPVHRS